jgi:hypothetical protein
VPATPNFPDAAPTESPPSQPPWRLSLDRIGFTQAIGGLVLGLIALFSSYDHITLAGSTIALQQQWGILCIAASVATVVVDAELASRSRLRAAHERQEDRDRADQDRNRAAEARERQRKSFERLDQAALLSGRFQFFLTLLAQSSLEDPQP